MIGSVMSMLGHLDQLTIDFVSDRTHYSGPFTTLDPSIESRVERISVSRARSRAQLPAFALPCVSNGDRG
jgi:hypothetical protein